MSEVRAHGAHGRHRPLAEVAIVHAGPVPVHASPTSAPPLPSGRFEHDVQQGTWAWSDSLFGIFGFLPGEVVPTTALVLSHGHPVDDCALQSILRQALATVGPFCRSAHLLDAGGRLRTVLIAGQAEADDRDRVVRLHGTVTDLSEARRSFTQQDVDDAVRSVVASRWSIEQAKGILMAGCGVDADTAFELLVQASQEHNVKVRDIAAALVGSLRAGGDEVARTRARDLLRRTLDLGLRESSTGA
jgi:PAS domain-containing protein